MTLNLIHWFSAHARDLPWRRTRDPYAIWVSEIMLQQTQVQTVLPYFDRWMRALPTVRALADASPRAILKLWEGLGYYRRVQNMQKAAQMIIEQHGGEFPSRFDDALALPGIGRYTAGAICSIAFNQARPIVDGNVVRVLTRLFGIRGNVREKQVSAQLWKLAAQLVDTAVNHERDLAPRPLFAGACSALNQSMMELGATVCTRAQPQCDDCPLLRWCVASRTNTIHLLPNVGARSGTTARRFIALLVASRSSLLVRKRPAGAVNGDLWEFPNIEVPLEAGQAALKRAAETELGCRIKSLRLTRSVRHTITRYRINLDAFHVVLNGDGPRRNCGVWKRTEEIRALPFASAHRKIATHVLDHAVSSAIKNAKAGRR